MGLNSTKSPPEYSLTLTSDNHFYRSPTMIEGQLYFNIRQKLLIEKKIHIDLIGQLIEHSKCSSKIFFTYSLPLVTCHDNGMARTIKQRQMTFPFRIPIGINLPPSCEFKEFSILYSLDVYHDDRLLLDLRKTILIASVTPPITVPLPCQVTDSNAVTMMASLQKSYYSICNGAVVPLSLSIVHSKQRCIHSIVIKLIAIVLLNEIKYENELFRVTLDKIKAGNTTYDLNLPANLSPTYIPNRKGRPDNVPSIGINYEFRLIAHMEGTSVPNLHLTVPIGIA